MIHNGTFYLSTNQEDFRLFYLKKRCFCCISHIGRNYNSKSKIINIDRLEKKLSQQFNSRGRSIILILTVPFQPLSDQKCGRYCRFSRFKSETTVEKTISFQNPKH